MKNELAIFEKDNETTMVLGKQPEGENEMVAMVNAVNSPSHRIADMVNMEINVVNFYVEKTQINNDGVIVDAFRTVLIDDNGESFGAVSVGVVNSLKNIVSFMGMPNIWERPLTVRVKEINTGTNRVLSLQLV